MSANGFILRHLNKLATWMWWAFLAATCIVLSIHFDRISCSPWLQYCMHMAWNQLSAGMYMGGLG